MAYRVVITEAAENDVYEAYLWYEEQKEGLGDIFESHLSKTIAGIKEDPLKLQVRYNTIRICFLKKFPYGIHFNITDKIIIIMAVFHTSRDPGIWKKRK